MQVNNQYSANQLQSTDRPLELKQGELYNAQIKERVSDTEAVIQIRGKEVKATFEGQVPLEDRVTLQVMGQKDQTVTVKTVSTDVPKASSTQAQQAQLPSDIKLLQSVGITDKDIPELKQSVQVLLNKGIPVTKEAVQELRDFFEKTQGSNAAKLDTVKALANKRLEVTQSHLRPIHEALHGRPLNEVLTDLAKEIDPEFDLAKNEQKDTVRRQTQQNVENSQKQAVENTSKVVKTEGNTAPETPSTVKTEQTSTPSVSKDKQLVELLQKYRDFVEKAPELKQAIEKVRSEIVKNPAVDRELAQKVEKAANEAEKLQSIGKERLVQALKNAEEQLVKRDQQNVIQNKGAQGKLVQEEARPSEIVKAVIDKVAKAPSLQRSIDTVKKQVVDNPRIPEAVATKVKQAVEEAGRLQQQGRITVGKETLINALNSVEADLEVLESVSKNQQQVKQADSNSSKINQPPVANKDQEARMSEVIRQVRAELQREPNLQQVVEKVRDQVVNNPKVDVEVAKRIDKAWNEAQQIQQIGREPLAREHLSHALAQAESELKQIEIRQQQQQQPTNQNQTEQRAIETIKQIKDTVQSEPNIQRAIDAVRDLLKNNKDMDPKIKNTIEKMTNQASQLDQAGRERVSKILDQAVDQIKQSNMATAENTKIQNSELPNENSTKIKPDQQQGQQRQPAQQEANQKLSQILANLLEQETTNENQKPSASAQINEALKQIQKESNLELALTQIRKELLSNPNLELNTIEKIEKVIDRSSQLLEKGRELGARQHITNALTEIEQELRVEPKQQNQPMDQQKLVQDELIKQFDQNEEFQTLPLQAKNILVTKVTQKLAQATHDFRELKREITKNLDTVERLIDTFKKNVYPQAKQILETTISKLDNAILKSDMMLFTDMKTEKQLMQASSQLADAKKLLAKGNHAEAAKIVHDIKTLLDKINFKPSEQKVMHFVSKETTNLEQTQKSPAHQLLNQFDETARPQVRQESSARQMFEMVRSLGLNHDSDLAKSLVFQKGGESSIQQGQGQDQQNQQQQENLKAALMKLTQTGGDEASTKIAHQAEQALNNLTGQQLLSKADSGNSLQSMFFSLPLLLGEKPENLQVFVNSKKEGQQVDWENCNLYFLIETKRMGDVGIMLTSTDRTLSITIKNDKPGFKQKMEPIAAITKEKLQEVGYSINSINFTRMTPINSQTAQNQQQDNTNKQEHQSQMKPVFTEKGMDFKI